MALKDKEEKKEKETTQLIEVDSQPQVDYGTAYAVQKDYKEIRTICHSHHNGFRENQNWRNRSIN